MQNTRLGLLIFTLGLALLSCAEESSTLTAGGGETDIAQQSLPEGSPDQDEGQTVPGDGSSNANTGNEFTKPQGDADAGGPTGEEKDGEAGSDTEDPGPACNGAGGFLCPCEDSTDCQSGFCVEGPDGSICSEPCVEECPDGFKCKLVSGTGPDVVYMCIPSFVTLCRPCNTHSECQVQGELDNRCVVFGEEEGSFCGSACESDEDCPADYSCASISEDDPLQCAPNSGECTCSEAAFDLDLSTNCAISNEEGTCEGIRICSIDEGNLTSCDAVQPEKEICDGLDNNCDGVTDEGTGGKECQVSNDEGSCTGTYQCNGGELSCDAKEATPEICDGVDNDCDGDTDEGFPDTDEDGDKDCYDTDDDNDDILDGSDNCPLDANPDQENNDLDEEGDLCDTDDDNDNIPDALDNCPLDANPDQGDLDDNGTGDVCDGDIDGDGDPNATDCDPENPDMFEGNDEICDGLDNDCDTEIDEETSGAACEATNEEGTCQGSLICTEGELLCNAEQPGPEVCDGVDNDCNGDTDEGFDDTDADGTADCVDTDLDGDGDLNGEDNCPNVNNPLQEDNDLDLVGDVCDTDDDNDNIPDLLDNCPFVANTGQEDNDGNNVGDACDLDADGDGDPNITDCAPTNPEIYNGNDEICGDGIDNNCVEGIDEPNALLCETYFLDEDEDGFGVGLDFVCLCEPQGDYTATVGGDCDDDNPDIYPNQIEICDDLNNNCSNGVDEGCDDDNDGYCDISMSVDFPLPETCLNGAGDCNDEAAGVHPDADEICDDIDNNCVSGIDEECNEDGDDYCISGSVVSNPAPSTCPGGGGDCNDNDEDTYPGAPDNPEIDFIDTNCDGIDGTVSNAVFVSGSTGNNNNPGTMTQPVKTITKGISEAQSQGKNAVLITGGSTYTELVTLENGISVYGGYQVAEKGWTRSQASVSKIFSVSGPGNQVAGVVADGISSPTTLQLLEIEASGGPSGGGSSHGIYVTAGNGLIVEHCEIIAGKGGVGQGGGGGFTGVSGGNGSAGANGKSDGSSGGGGGSAGFSACGASGGSGGSGGYNTGSGTKGNNGGNGGGTGGSGGSGGNDCNDSGAGGNSGAGVGNGANGAGGSGGSLQGGFWFSNSGNSGSKGFNGRGGGGGGGGAGGSSCASCYTGCNLGFLGCACNADRGGGGGGGGGGGCGGFGGNGGGGGGGSFGIFLNNANADIHDCTITTTGGGKGGSGGLGGSGGSGGSGGNGGNGPDDSGAGGSGGDGSPGGNGGHGGGGAGGASFGIYQAGNSAATIDVESIQFNVGTGGGGGNSSGNSGAAGPSGAVF